MRTCRRCGETKSLTEFDLRADTGKYRTECKACRREYQRRASPGPRAIYVIGTDEQLLCRVCGVRKPWTEFPRRGRESQRLQTWCKACFSAYKAKRHQLNHDREMRRIRRNSARYRSEARTLIRAYLLEHPCVDCGESDVAVLDFDHVRDSKRMDVSALVAGGYSWHTIADEIAKCDVRCANCHRRVTRARRKHAA